MKPKHRNLILMLSGIFIAATFNYFSRAYTLTHNQALLLFISAFVPFIIGLILELKRDW